MKRFPLAEALAALLLAGCASLGTLDGVKTPRRDFTVPAAATSETPTALVDLDATFTPGTADPAHRYLGRLRSGSVADTIDIVLLGDNRPGQRSYALAEHSDAVRGMWSLNPVAWGRGLLHLPALLVRGFIPDLKIVRDIPGRRTHQPTFSEERAVITATEHLDEQLALRGRRLALVLNSGDLVEDGRRPDQWRRFLELSRAAADRRPYLPVAGNHERTEDARGLENWFAATGLPRWPEPLCYCFDSADEQLRFVVLDSNPLVDAKDGWPPALEESLAVAQLGWLQARLAEHAGPAIVVLHHPPFSAGRHRGQWQARPETRARRERLVRAILESNAFLLLAGHEHAYQRAVLSSPRGERLIVTSGGAGSPLHVLPNPTESAALFAAYDGAWGTFPPSEVRARSTYNLVHLRLWPGGGEMNAYAVHGDDELEPLDRVSIETTPRVAVTTRPLEDPRR
jgi:hypothetical protein